MTITDEMVKKAAKIWYAAEPSPHNHVRMRAALEAVAPMLMTEKSAIAFLETKGWVFDEVEHEAS